MKAYVTNENKSPESRILVLNLQIKPVCRDSRSNFAFINNNSKAPKPKFQPKA